MATWWCPLCGTPHPAHLEQCIWGCDIGSWGGKGTKRAAEPSVLPRKAEPAWPPAWPKKAESAWTNVKSKPGAAFLKPAPKGSVAALTSFTRQFLEPPPALTRQELEMVEAERAALEVAVDGGQDAASHGIPPVSTFEELTMLPDYAFAALQGMDITAPMPIQAQALPIILSGNDLVGVAKTGSGKTLAYLLPAVVHIEAQRPLEKGSCTPIALALAPTRELAIQISEEAQKLVQSSAGQSSHPGGVWAACIYGGLDKSSQLRRAVGAHIIAATPGRLMDCVEGGQVSMKRVTYFVLDEGDRMLDDGFEDQLKSIAREIRKDRHMLFFSATWPKKVQDLAKNMCQGSRRPVRLRVGQTNESGATSREDIVQEVIVFDQGDWEERDTKKQRYLYRHLREALSLEGTKVLVFVSRKDLADKMAAQFESEGFAANALHGGRNQETRMRVLEDFKNWTIRLLVTTDVMGRGLDIPTISHVVVYDMGDVDDYVHRIGRTARGPYGKGHALTLFEYNNKWPHLAEGLIDCLEAAGQEVPDELRKVANEVHRGWREVKAMKAGSKWGDLSGWQGSASNMAFKKLGYGAGDWGKEFGSW